MKPEEQIKALAELGGWTIQVEAKTRPSGDPYSACHHGTNVWMKPGVKWNELNYQDQREYLRKEFAPPQYLTSYDAIIPVIQKQPHEVKCNMWNHLEAESDLWTNTPSQLCEALLRATGKWKE